MRKITKKTLAVLLTTILLFLCLSSTAVALHGRIGSDSGYASTIRGIVRLQNGNMVFVRESGWITITDSEFNRLSDGRWSHSSYSIYAAAPRPDGSVVIAGQSGRWQILNSDGSLGPSGTWSHGSTNINAVAVLSDGTALLVGDSGRAQFLGTDNQLQSTFTSGVSHVYTAAARPDDSIIIAGYYGM